MVYIKLYNNNQTPADVSVMNDSNQRHTKYLLKKMSQLALRLTTKHFSGKLTNIIYFFILPCSDTCEIFLIF